ncbi:unnamed protein product [Caenorhabditis auriculariae]|uniref:Uncharacterized protein n=1 Tax=Caenorhabditis auriculariae TaxID=2777116 RepID=A0A8S1HVA7_9PELO|nr:unnamed protein product [Caenorhabditis auriculariae]
MTTVTSLPLSRHLNVIFPRLQGAFSVTSKARAHHNVDFTTRTVTIGMRSLILSHPVPTFLPLRPERDSFRTYTSMIFGKKTTLSSPLSEEVPKKRKSLLRKLSVLSGLSFDSSPSYSASSSPRTPSPRHTLDNVLVRCELTLLSALQGAHLTCDERQNCAAEIEAMTFVEKRHLIDFFHGENNAAICALENNACKAFLCSTLATDVLLDHPETVCQLWSKLYHEIVPALQSMCYPLQAFEPSFDVQKTILTAFRDRVLSKLLRDVQFSIPEVHGLLFTIMLETDNVPASFRQLADVCMGNTQHFARYRVKPIRSRTLPNESRKKSVSWVDARKSATFST